MFAATTVTGLVLLLAYSVMRPVEGGTEPFAIYSRPDGKFSVLVVRERSWLSVMPGHGGDVAGEVRLLDAEGHVLERQRVEMVQLVEKVEWSDDRVSIKLIADWKLPASQ